MVRDCLVLGFMTLAAMVFFGGAASDGAAWADVAPGIEVAVAMLTGR